VKLEIKKGNESIKDYLIPFKLKRDIFRLVQNLYERDTLFKVRKEIR